MSEEKILELDQPRNYKKRKTIMDDYINIIYKMLKNNIDIEIIYQYIKLKGYQGSDNSLLEYIAIINNNNFPSKPKMIRRELRHTNFPKDVIVIKRNELLKHLLTLDSKKNKNKDIEKYLDIIKEKYPIVEEVQTIFNEFHSTIMGDNTDALDDFLKQHKDSKIAGFCKSIKKDIVPVKNAISYSISSGFVEGNNNKFKLLKRIVYGKSNLVNLFKKCSLAFLWNKKDFNLFDLVN